MKKRRIGIVRLVVMTVITVLIVGFIVLPFYSMVLLSIVPESLYLREDILLFPKEFSLESFIYIFSNNAIFKGVVITVIVTIVGTFYNMILTVTSAYVLTRKFYGKKIYSFLIFMAMFFDGGLVSNYLLIKNLGLIDRIFSMILPTGINIAYLLLLTKAFSEIPQAIVESAKIDGANDIDILFRIIVPVSKPILVAICLYYAVERWNEWYLGMLYINSSAYQPLQLILRGIISNINSIRATELMDNLGMIPFSDGIKMACTIVTMIPIVIVYPFLQKHFISGLADGAIKE